MDRRALLEAAIEDNIAWCSAVSAAHDAQVILTDEAWANLAAAPRYYPNVITRREGAQAAVTALMDRLHGPRPWSIKDSFHDLDLHHLGFVPVIEAQWFGGDPASVSTMTTPWERVRTSQELARWAEAWGEGTANSPFKSVFLSDPRIGFWQSRQGSLIVAGGISFASGPVVGLSNWFAKGDETAFALGLTAAICRTFPGLPIVLWSDEEAADCERYGLTPLGSLRVWVAD